MDSYEQHFIGGQWVQPSQAGHFDVISASTEEVIGRVPAGNAQDVDRAVQAARSGFAQWSQVPAAERVAKLSALASALERDNERLACTITAEVGMPLKLSRRVQAGLPALVMKTYADMLPKFVFEEELGNSLLVHEPIGVVGCITPWNYPLHQVVAKVAPALAAGCSVVLKPSEVAPLSAFRFAELVEEVGLPAGVFNLVCGEGSVVGEALAAHPDVDMLSFTGSTRAGKRVAELAAATVKRVTQELGGKSPNLLLDDADFAKAVRAGVGNCYLNSGQTCTALTRMLVPKGRKDEVVALAKEAAESYLPGDPTGERTRLGPLVSAAQRERVRDYIRRGVEQGATLVTGGPEAPEGLERGYYVRPTVFADVTPDMSIAREEIFGPVLCILTYEDEEQGVRLANDSIYGLAAGVWSTDLERAHRVARRLRAGQVDVNGGGFNPLAPFGGYKHSGNGRELGSHGLREYLEVKAIQRPAK